MKRLVWVLLSSIVWFGCKSGIPNDIIEPDRMEKILYDIHIVDGYLSTIYVPDSSKKVASAYYKGIFKKFGTDSIQYYKSLVFYNTNPKELEAIYKNISNKIEKQKKGMEKIDSINAKKKMAVPVKVKPVAVKSVEPKKIDSIKLKRIKARKTKSKKAKIDSLKTSRAKLRPVAVK